MNRPYVEVVIESEKGLHWAGPIAGDNEPAARAEALERFRKGQAMLYPCPTLQVRTHVVRTSLDVNNTIL